MSISVYMTSAFCQVSVCLRMRRLRDLRLNTASLRWFLTARLMIGDIIASGETLIHCLRYVTDFYSKHGARLRNIIVFTIGGTRASISWRS